MDALKTYYKKLDGSNYDCMDSDIINSELQQVRNQLLEEGKQDIAAIADLDRQVFLVNKSFDTKKDAEKGTINGLSWQLSESQTLEDGSKVNYYSPDVASYTLKDFKYFEKRYKECVNLYAKTEYGLMIYFGAKTEYSKHNNFKRKLFNELFQLSKQYYSKGDKGGEKNFYILEFFNTFRLAFEIIEKSKFEPELSDITKYLFDLHQNWDITKEDTLRILFDISGLMSDHFNYFNSKIDFQKIVDKNMQSVKELEKSDIWGAIYAIDRNIAIYQKWRKSVSSLLNYKARLYEKLSSDADSRSNNTSVRLAENALRIFKELDESEDINRLEKIYAEYRGKFRLSEISQELPKEYNDNLSISISKAVAENDEIGIINHFITSPWYDKINNIKDRSIELRKQSVLFSRLPNSIIDKFGNTVDIFKTDSEKMKFNFWYCYSISFQLGTQTMYRFFTEAYKSGKLNYSSTILYLESTWFNEVINRNYQGQSVEVKPIDTIKPGLKRIFIELENLNSDIKYKSDLVTIIDSLTLKVEGLLRYFCEKIGIATFKLRQKGSDKLVTEKLLDDLLSDIAHKPPLKPDQETNFDEEDRIYIKYVMSEKVGLNLRNSVAHSLMDIYEYSFEYIIILFCIILKLSKYKFIDTKGENENDNSSK